MLVRKMLMGAVLAVLLAVLWKYFVAGRLNALAPEHVLPSAIKQEVAQVKELAASVSREAKVEPLPVESLPQSPAGIHKCKVGNTVTYTDEPCKNPAAERPLDKGSVTVVKSESPEVAAPDHKGRLPNVRDLAGPPGEPSIMDKQIERAINH